MEQIPEAEVERLMRVREVMLQAMSKKITWWQAADDNLLLRAASQVYFTHRCGLKQRRRISSALHRPNERRRVNRGAIKIARTLNASAHDRVVSFPSTDNPKTDLLDKASLITHVG